MDSDVAGLLVVLSRDAATSSGREPAASDARDSGDETGERRVRYPPDLGDSANTGNTSRVFRLKSNRTLLGDSCTDDKCDTCDP